jgi:CubicO group peptidase (beta-lactamase class C family)
MAVIGVFVAGGFAIRPAATPEVSGDAPTTTESLNSFLESIRQNYDLPALGAAIVTSKGGLIASGAVGVRKDGTNSPVTVNDQFHLGSDTKAVTATPLATLVEAGKLAWTTTIELAFPELASKMNPGYRQVALEQLVPTGSRRHVPSGGFSTPAACSLRRDDPECGSAWSAIS